MTWSTSYGLLVVLLSQLCLCATGSVPIEIYKEKPEASPLSPSFWVETAFSNQPEADRISIGRHQVISKFHPARLPVLRLSSLHISFVADANEGLDKQHGICVTHSQHLPHNSCPKEPIARSHTSVRRAVPQPVAVVDAGGKRRRPNRMHLLTDVGHFGHLSPFCPHSIQPASLEKPYRMLHLQFSARRKYLATDPSVRPQGYTH
ncbi:hypothetical protein B0T20DRAFT_221284 [Sordaria brevicollis]|uniref:Uncharacterized protein n=1 Tax=Sordaria brevicollis TaxID=83679 RepID=A0AAE0PCN3_SORBR|nr:hypothetical protein B0T20DRAFT_221284 [Sordaria brevicollis]